MCAGCSQRSRSSSSLPAAGGGAAEAGLAPGDVAWWDFRSWRDEMQQPAVVGAFPAPFRNGFGGHTRPLEIIAPPELRDEREAVERLPPRVGGGGAGRAAPARAA